MDNQLDSLLTQLRDRDLDRELGAVEHDVRRRIAHDRSARAGLAPARMAAVSFALVLGTGIGGLTAASAVAPPRSSIFATANALAPSSLLEGAR